MVLRPQHQHSAPTFLEACNGRNCKAGKINFIALKNFGTWPVGVRQHYLNSLLGFAINKNKEVFRILLQVFVMD